MLFGYDLGLLYICVYIYIYIAYPKAKREDNFFGFMTAHLEE